MTASSETACVLGLWTVIVYPSLPPAAAAAESAVFVVDNGARPSGEKTVRCERVADPPIGRLRSQLRPAPLSM